MALDRYFAAGLLGTILAARSGTTGAKQVVLIAHSLGGLMAPVR
jgi:hypothetical protein